MYLVNRQLHPPTTVDISLSCHFYDMKEKQLIVAASNQIKIFRLICEEADEDSTDNKDVKLECLQTFSLFGHIADIKSVTLPSALRDSLLICFHDAKVSVVEYDPTTHGLKTVALHYMEDDEMKCGRTQFSPPILRVDPESRCAAVLAYGQNIVIIPFKKELAAVVAEEYQQSSHVKKSGAFKSLASTSYKLNLQDEAYAGENINNIIDMQFLEGYYEPTLLILHEPIQTWPGRLAVRTDTCAMVTLSLNILQKVHPIIWSLNHLPYDCLRTLAVPKPIGGVLVFAVNSIMYLNQSVPPYAVSLNGMGDGFSAFPMTSQKGVQFSLDASQACFISEDKLVISLRGGDLYVLTLFNDGMRSIRKFHFEKAAASVMTSCITSCEPGYLFLGSRLGNSLLLKYVEKPYVKPESVAVENGDSASENDMKDDNAEAEGEPPEKVAKVEEKEESEADIGHWLAKDVALMKQDDLEVYGEVKDEEEKLPTSFTFHVCDSIANVGPCGKICMGQPAFLAEEFQSNPTGPHIELLTTSGYGKNGAVSLIHRTIRPHVVTTFNLPDCTRMWTVRSKKTDEGFHSFLILSKSDTTMVFQTGQEINELDQSGFTSQTESIYVGNLGGDKYVIQVAPSSIRLLEDVRQIQYIPVDLGSPIVRASSADPFTITLTKSGQVSQIQLIEDRLHLTKPSLSSTRSKIIDICLYQDVSGLFTTSSVDETDSTTKSNTDDVSSNLLTTTVDEEDELLYGDSTVEDIAGIDSHASKIWTMDKDRCNIRTITRNEASYWLFVARENGVLEIYSAPDYKLCYYIKNFPMAHKIVVDSVQGFEGKEDQQTLHHMPRLQELLVTGLGVKESRPMIFARFPEQIVIYETFPFHENQVMGHLKIRFKKVDSHVVLETMNNDEDGISRVSDTGIHETWLNYFSDVSGYSGVFLSGSRPTWFMMGPRGELRQHEMSIDGAVKCFAPFHNVNCSHGFLYFNDEDDLRISVIPTQVSYDAPWPLRKVPLRSTVHFVNYHVESKCYIIVTSTQEKVTKLVKIASEDKDFDVLERDEKYIWPTREKFSMQLFSPVSWELIPGTKLEFEEWEHVTCIQNVSLASEGTESGMKGYIAVGTNYCYGEDVTNRGRIWILDIIEVVPEPGQPLTKNKIKMVYNKEQKGPVTTLCQVKGFLMSAIGQKIYIWQLKESQLVGVAFIDTQIYIHSSVSIKNLILVADIHKSISLLRYQEETRTLALVSRDTRSYEVYAAHFVVDSNQLCFVVSDSDSNLIVYSYNPELRESFGGTRLIRRADFHLGSRVNTFFRIKARNYSDFREQSRQLTVYATLDGGLGYLLPIVEKTYRRLLMLQSILNTHIQHVGGLNPKAFRLCKYSKRILASNSTRSILDGDLLFKYLTLSMSEKSEVAKKIGTTTDQITIDLHDIEMVSSHF